MREIDIRPLVEIVEQDLLAHCSSNIEFEATSTQITIKEKDRVMGGVVPVATIGFLPDFSRVYINPEYQVYLELMRRIAAKIETQTSYPVVFINPLKESYS